MALDDVFGEQARLFPAEPLQLDLRRRAQRLHGSDELEVTRVEVLTAGARGHQETRPGFGAQQVVNDLERLDVAPLNVLDNEQQRHSGPEDRPGRRREQPLALLVLGQRPRRRKPGHLGGQLGE